jgi:hypothetical protein
MNQWARHFSECQNCGTKRRRHHARGYCKPCWSMMKLIWEAEKWDTTQPGGTSNMPPIPGWTRDAIVAGLDRRAWSDDEFERYRREFIRQYRLELTRLREREQSRHKPVTGWDVESQLRFVHRHIRPKATRMPFHGIARSINDRFDGEQRSILYGILVDLIDHVPWVGISHEEFWRRVCRGAPKNSEIRR